MTDEGQKTPASGFDAVLGQRRGTDRPARPQATRAIDRARRAVRELDEELAGLYSASARRTHAERDAGAVMRRHGFALADDHQLQDVEGGWVASTWTIFPASGIGEAVGTLWVFFGESANSDRAARPFAQLWRPDGVRD